METIVDSKTKIERDGTQIFFIFNEYQYNEKCVLLSITEMNNAVRQDVFDVSRFIEKACNHYFPLLQTVNDLVDELRKLKMKLEDETVYIDSKINNTISILDNLESNL